MRLPLKLQIVAPLAAVTLATIAGLVAYQSQVAARAAADRIDRQIEGVTQTLAESSFPLTPGVLRQLRDLSGANFVVEGRRGDGATTIALSDEARRTLTDLSGETSSAGASPPTPAGRRRLVTLDGAKYFHADVVRREFGRGDRIHLLYAESEYRRAVAAAAWPPVALGLAALAAVVAAGWWTAWRITRAVRTVGDQVEQIAGGDFHAADAPVRNDELGDLQRGVDRMAGQLAQYEAEVRRTERLRTLGQLGAGLAHEIRNAATGARLALQHHQTHCSGSNDSPETLRVAGRQLEHIEEYVQRFVRLGREDFAGRREATDLGVVAADAVRLAEPYARHRGVSLTIDAPRAVPLTIDAAGVRQAIYNLLINAIDAAGGRDPAAVDLRVEQFDAAVRVIVSDTGLGPTPELADRVFDAFVTDKPDGAGLGLALVQRVAAEHNGEIAWRRDGPQTVFTLTLPRDAAESAL